MTGKTKKTYKKHLGSSSDLQTDYKAYRAGFVSLAIERNRRATPFVDEARQLKTIASEAREPEDLLNVLEIRAALISASGISEKASAHLQESDKVQAIGGLIGKFLKPAGSDFVEELVYRFLLTRGDTLGGSMRNVGGTLAVQKFTRAVISFLNLSGTIYHWRDKMGHWSQSTSSVEDADIELNVRGLSWQSGGCGRTMIYNLNVPAVLGNNIDICLFDCSYQNYGTKIIIDNERYIALGEIKGGIDPAGADEHWKTARTAFTRINDGFALFKPATFFVGAAIEKKMASEIWDFLEKGTLTNAANLTVEDQLSSIIRWLCQL